MGVLVADGVWIATALRHRRYPEKENFTVSEIVQRAEAESVPVATPCAPSFQGLASSTRSLALPVPHKSMLDFLVPIRYGARHGVPEPSHP